MLEHTHPVKLKVFGFSPIVSELFFKVICHRSAPFYGFHRMLSFQKKIKKPAKYQIRSRIKLIYRENKFVVNVA